MLSAFSSDFKGISVFYRYYMYANIWLPRKGLRPIGAPSASNRMLYPIRIHKKSRKVKQLIIVDDQLATASLTRHNFNEQSTLFLDLGGRSKEKVDYRLAILYRLFDFLPVLSIWIPILYRYSLRIRSKYRKLFWTFFFKYFNNIETIFLTDSYIKIECIYIYRKLLSGSVIEFKHGLVSQEHVGYGPWILGLSRMFRPDSMLHSGIKFDLVGISNEGLKSLNDLNYDVSSTFSLYRAGYKSVQDFPNGKCVVIISQPTMRDYTKKLYDDLLNKGVNIKIRPHPRDRWGEKVKIERSLSKNVIYIGWYSTYILELFQLGYEVYSIRGFWNILTALLPDSNFIEYDSRNT